MSDRIVVVGSLNLDLVAQVARLPRPGETVLGHRHFRNPGGKGANQAVAAARLGGRVSMVGRVGDDDPGQLLLDVLARDDVDTRHVRRLSDVATGLAVITVDDNGENTIVVSAGANDRVSADDVERASDVLDDAAVCLLQFEIPDAPVAAAARRAHGTVILNPAPARMPSDELLDAVDVLVPNQSELGVMAGAEPPDGAEAAAAIAAGLGFGGAVVVTLGSSGAVVVDGGGSTVVPAPHVDAVDTTAAGDAFCGALAAGLTKGADLVEATRWACSAGAVAATRPGAQQSLPTVDDVEELLHEA